MVCHATLLFNNHYCSLLNWRVTSNQHLSKLCYLNNNFYVKIYNFSKSSSVALSDLKNNIIWKIIISWKKQTQNQPIPKIFSCMNQMLWIIESCYLLLHYSPCQETQQQSTCIKTATVEGRLRYVWCWYVCSATNTWIADICNLEWKSDCQQSWRTGQSHVLQILHSPYANVRINPSSLLRPISLQYTLQFDWTTYNFF